VAAVIAARGGHGITRIASDVDFGVLRRSPKWLIGFSEYALHVEASSVGVGRCTPTCGRLGRGDGMRGTLYRGGRVAARAAHTPGLPLRPAACGGRSWAHLTVLFTCAVTGRLRLPAGHLGESKT